MLGILKVNAGISTDGTAEFSLTVVDVQDHVYEVQIDDIAYAQIVGVIEESTGAETEAAPGPAAPEMAMEQPEAPVDGGNGASLSPEKRAALAQVLAGTPQHVVEGEDQDPSIGAVSLSDVGFDIDYSAEMGEYADEDDADPGELVDDDYVEPL